MTHEIISSSIEFVVIIIRANILPIYANSQQPRSVAFFDTNDVIAVRYRSSRSNASTAVVAR
jgi:hypothetical protein